MNIFFSRNLSACCILFLTICLLSSCGGKKLTIMDRQGKLKSRTEPQLINDILSNELNYKVLSTRGKVSFAGKDLTAVFKLVKDSVLQASIRPLLGIEVARLDITPSKLILLDRMNKQYAEISTDQEVFKSIAFNFYNLQAILTNQLFIPGQKDVVKEDYKKFKYSISGDAYILGYQDKNELDYKFWIDNMDRVKQLDIFSLTSDATVNWEYDNFVEDQEKHIYPTEIQANIQVQDKKFKLGISYTKLDIDKKFTIDTKIPSNYTKRDLKELVRDYVK